MGKRHPRSRHGLSGGAWCGNEAQAVSCPHTDAVGAQTGSRVYPEMRLSGQGTLIVMACMAPSSSAPTTSLVTATYVSGSLPMTAADYLMTCISIRKLRDSLNY